MRKRLKNLKPGEFLVEMLEDEERFKLKKGDILVATESSYDDEKYTIEYRQIDGYDPMCAQYKSSVRRIK